MKATDDDVYKGYIKRSNQHIYCDLCKMLKLIDWKVSFVDCIINFFSGSIKISNFF